MPVELVLYLIDVLNSLNVLFTVYLVASIAFIFIGFFATLDEETPQKEYCKIAKKIFCTWTVTLFFLVIIPSEKTMYLMTCANYLKNTTIPSKVEQAIEKKLDKYLEEDKKEKK